MNLREVETLDGFHCVTINGEPLEPGWSLEIDIETTDHRASIHPLGPPEAIAQSILVVPYLRKGRERVQVGLDVFVSALTEQLDAVDFQHGMMIHRRVISDAERASWPS